MKKRFFAGRKVLVMGLGRFGGGVDAVRFVAQAGAKVTVTDLASTERLCDSINQLKDLDGIEFHLGCHDPADFEQADMIVANPAVTPDNEFLQIARRGGRLVTSQMGIFFQLCPAQIIGITGANGKSTTTALTAHILKSTNTELRTTNYEHVWLSGNIGDQPLLTILDRIGPNDLVVLEISSFQIEQLAQVQQASRVALLTNLTPNHLDRYGTFEAYCAAKESIFKYQRLDVDAPAISIFNAEDEVAAKWFEKYNGQAGRVCVRFSADDVSADVRKVFGLPGRANLSNLAAAMAVARSFGLGEDAIKACLAGFKALPHRLELVAQIDGVRWYNDSKATTPLSSMAALDAFDCPEILIAGGHDKHLPFDRLGERIAEKAKAAVLIGQTAAKIAEAIRSSKKYLAPQSFDRAQDRFIAGLPNNQTHDTQYAPRTTKIEIVNSLAEAVQLAGRIAVPGDVVLLSPACASYDMFENYQQRGREFTRLVRGGVG